MKKSRRKFTSGFKTQVVLELLKERNTLSEIAEKYEVHPTVISKWKTEFLDKASMVFETEKEKSKESLDPEELYKEIGKMKVENEWLKKKLVPYL
jgi:transposase